MQKIDEKKVYVRLQNTKLKALTKAIGFLVMSAADSDFKAVARSFSFMIDLDDADGVQAYKELLGGNVIAAQKLARDKDVQAVVAIEDINAKTKGHMRSHGIAFFMMHNRKAQGTQISDTQIEFHPDRSKTQVDYAVFVKDYNKRFFNKHTERVIAFYGADYTRTNAQQEKQRGTLGQWVWNYENDHASTSHLRNELRKIVRRTGLAGAMATELVGDKYLGYLNVKVQMNIPDAATKSLMAIAKSTEKAVIFDKISTDFVTSYFQNGRDDNDACAAWHNTDAPFSQSTCISALTTYTQQAMGQMKAALKTMAETSGAKYAKAYGQFGRAMMTNQFTFQTVLNLVKGRGGNINVKIAGQNLPLSVKKLEWIPEAQ